MSWRLKKTESPTRALRRACRRHVDQALGQLKQAGRPESVHNVRKEIKRLRAIFKLTRGGLKRRERGKTSKAMRLAAKPLAPARDARVIQKAFESLVGRNTEKFARIKSALENGSILAQRSFKAQNSGALSQYILKEVGGRLHDMRLKRGGWAEIEACLKSSYTRGRDVWRMARLDRAPEHFHEFRKRVKSLWYQLDFLCPDWPAKTKATMVDLEKLGERLGDEHDLALLGEFASAHCRDREELTALQALIDAKRGKLTSSIRRLGERLYARTPAAVCAQLEADWKKWRDGG